MEQAERDAFNVVLKRLMPVSAYAQLPDLSQQNVEELIEGVSIRSERNSTHALPREPRCQLQQPGGEAAPRQPEHSL